MNKIFSFFLLISAVVFIFSGNLFSADDNIDKILANIEKKNSSVKDMQAEYVQTITYFATDEKLKSEGIFKHKKTDYINLVQLLPTRQYTYIDGKNITTYVPANKQAVVEKWKNVVDGDVILTSVFKFTKNFKTLKKDYNIVLKDQTNIDYSFLIKPINKKEDWTMAITVSKANSLVTASSFNNGNFVVDIEIKNYKINNNFSNDIFRFVAPKNVDVIEL
ncbi:MAG: outer membrane lipoprotein carrier protein LolA [Elusimicrobia bacterium]|nr:outer membrane lipoprotein carrier protein LolA [Elusimicrobiota bacterium]